MTTLRPPPGLTHVTADGGGCRRKQLRLRHRRSEDVVHRAAWPSIQFWMPPFEGVSRPSALNMSVCSRESCVILRYTLSERVPLRPHFAGPPCYSIATPLRAANARVCGSNDPF
jgi:hypothetical protein